MHVTYQLNCALRHHAVQCQHTTIILQTLAIQNQLLPLCRCVLDEGLALQVRDHIKPRTHNHAPQINIVGDEYMNPHALCREYGDARA